MAWSLRSAGAILFCFLTTKSKFKVKFVVFPWVPDLVFTGQPIINLIWHDSLPWENSSPCFSALFVFSSYTLFRFQELGVLASLEGTLNITLYSPYWMVNKTGLYLEYKVRAYTSLVSVSQGAVVSVNFPSNKILTGFHQLRDNLLNGYQSGPLSPQTESLPIISWR